MSRTGSTWRFTPDQFALAWARTDGDRIPYPLAVRQSAADTAERTAQLPGLNRWCDRALDADLTAALQVLARPRLTIEVYGERIVAESRTEPESVRPVRILGTATGALSVVAAQRPGVTAESGGDIRLFVGSTKTLSARVVSMLPDNRPGRSRRLTAPLVRVNEDSRDLVTIPVSGPSAPARIRKLLKQPREGIGQIIVSAHGKTEPAPPSVLCWINVTGDGRYTVCTGTDVDIVAVTAATFTAQLRPLIGAVGRRTGAVGV